MFGVCWKELHTPQNKKIFIKKNLNKSWFSYLILKRVNERQTYLNTTKSLLYFAKSIGTGATDWSLVLTSPTSTPEYANNASALFAGLVAGQIYRTGDLLKIVH